MTAVDEIYAVEDFKNFSGFYKLVIEAKKMPSICFPKRKH
jgi:hypothetical protein